MYYPYALSSTIQLPMNPIKKRILTASSILIVVLVVDQIVKCLVKTQMLLHEKIEITSWFNICFIENRGMAFGMDFIGTYLLTLFRVIAVGAFVWILVRLIKKQKPLGLIACLSLVVAGAAGNIIDNCFYGLIFEESPSVGWAWKTPAQFVPFGEGYGSFLTGKVVDMFYFPLFTWPDWMPFVGGDVFFNAIFNVADAAISCGAVALLLFYHNHLTSQRSSEKQKHSNDELSRSSKSSFRLLLFLPLLAACDGERDPQVLSPNQMEEVLYDFHLAQAMGKTTTDSMDYRSNLYTQAALAKHQLSTEDFDRSMEWYTRHADELFEIYQNVEQRFAEATSSAAWSHEQKTYSLSGDTANIWNGKEHYLLNSQDENRLAFYLPADTLVGPGDRLELRFETNWHYHEGQRSASAMLAVRLANDSVQFVNTQLLSSGRQKLSLKVARQLVKSVEGFVFLQTPWSETPRMLEITNPLLLRYKQ